MTQIQTDWEGYYLDGRTAARQRVTIRIMRLGLHVTTEKGETLWWPYEEIHQTQGFYAGEQVRLERGGEFAEVLLVSDATFLTNLHRMALNLAKKFHNPAHRRIRAKITLLAALSIIAITVIFYLWGFPALATLAASRVPVSWEEHLGRSVVEQLAPPGTRCTDPARTQVIDEIIKVLTSPLPTSPYKFHVIVVNSPIFNAFAAPGGYIVLFHGLLEQTRTPEELAGVLAHELQHILQRHSTRALIHHVSTGLFLAALTGDVSGATAYGLEAARIVGMLQYSRLNEEEADMAGMRMILDANIDPKGMIAFFELLRKESPATPAFLKYISTHPSTEDRIQRLKLLAGKSESRPVKMLQDYDWNDIKKICETLDRPA